MKKMFISVIKILIAFNLIALISALSCSLNLRDPKWVKNWYLLVVRDSNNNYQLLRTDEVAAKSDLLIFCNREPHMIEARCQEDGTFNREIPPREKCNWLDSLKPIKVQQKVSYCPHDLYTIGFNIPVGNSTHFLPAYKVCFDRKHLRLLFAIDRAYPHVDNRPTFLKFSPDEIFSNEFFNAFKPDGTFDRFKKLLGDQQTYMNKPSTDPIINRGHMAPCGDFVTTNLKGATFNMINVIPQFKSINNGNWQLIEKWSRRTEHAASDICTGVLDCNLDSTTLSDLHCVLQLKGKGDKMEPMFLADNRKIPIPLWTYKIVKQQQVVFLTLNNIYHKGKVEAPVQFCNVKTCDESVLLGTTVAKGITFCCSYNEFISKNVPHLRNVC